MASALAVRGDAARRSGRIPESLALYRRAMQLDAGAPLALLKLDRIAEARQEIVVIEVLEAGGNHFYTDRIREIVARL